MEFNRLVAAVLPKILKSSELLLSENCNLTVHEEYVFCTQVVVPG